MRAGVRRRAAGFIYPDDPSQPAFRPGAEIEIIPEQEAHITDLPAGGREGVPPGFDVSAQGFLVKARRRRRRRMLSAQDRADIAFLIGILGKGALAQAAITSLLHRGR